MGSSTSKPISTSVNLLEILSEDLLILIIVNFDIFTFPSLILTCKKIRQLSLKTAWKIAVKSHPKRPHKDCVQFICQEARSLKLPPMLIPLSHLCSCPDSFQVKAFITDLTYLTPYFSRDELTSMIIDSDQNLYSLTQTDAMRDKVAEEHANFFRRSFVLYKKNLKSLMLKNIYISPKTLEPLNNSIIGELHLNHCFFDPTLINTYRDNFDFNSLTKLHIEVEGIFSINSQYMFKNLKELIIHQYCSNPQFGEEAHLQIYASYFKSLEYL